MRVLIRIERGTTRAAAAALALIVLAACSRREERELTGWLKLEIVRPVTGTSGVVVVGSNEEVFQARVGNRWETLGSGHPTRYMVLNDPNKESYEKDSQPAVLVDLNNGQGLQIVRAGEDRLRSLQEVFRRTGDLSVPSGRTAIDILDCRESAKPTGCRVLDIHRYHPSGTHVKTFHVSLRDSHPGCRILAVRGYDSVDTPYLNAQCADSERAQCLLVAPRPDSLFVREVGKDRPARECSAFPGLGVALGAPARFEVLH